MLKADKDGFLQGEPVEVSRGSFDAAIAIWKQVQGDVAQIKRAVVGANRPVMVSEKSMAKVAEKLSSSVRAAVPARQRDAQGRFVKSEASMPAGRRGSVAMRMAQPSQNVRTVMPEQNIATPNSLKAAPERGVNGRFKGNGTEGGDSGSKSDYRGFGEVADAIRDSSSAAIQGTEQIDPTLQAAGEITGLLGPVLKPFGGLFKTLFGGGKDKAIPWYRRIVNELRDINEKTEGSGGFLKFILMALMALPALLGKLLPSFLMRALAGSVIGKGLGAVGKVLGRAGGAVLAGGKTILGKGKDAIGSVGGMAKTAGSVGKGLLKRIPLLGALIGGGMLADAAMRPDDPSKSDAENREGRFKDGGGGVGAMVGTALGAMGGPLGMMVGSFLGEMVGEKVGTWLSGFDWNAIGASITNTWSAAVAGVTGMWSAVTGTVGSAFTAVSDTIGKAWAGAADWFKEMWKPVSDVFAAAGKWLQDKLGFVVEPIKKAAAVVSETASNAKNAVLERVDTAKSGASRIMEKLSGRAGEREAAMKAEMTKSGITDPKERAMFMAQVSHESGGFTETSENLNYRSADRIKQAFAGNKNLKGMSDAQVQGLVGNPEALANTVYGGRMGNKDPGDGYKFRGRGALQLTGRENYERAGKDLGLDLVGNPDQVANDPAVSAKVAAWYWKDRKLGEKARAGDVVGVTKGVNGGLNGLEDRKELYAGYLAKEGSTTQAVSPKAMTSAALMPPMAAPATAGSMPAAMAASMPSAAAVAIPKAPSVSTPLASNRGGNSTTVSIKKPVGQNIGDRGIAQAATGGIGMRG